MYWLLKNPQLIYVILVLGIKEMEQFSTTETEYCSSIVTDIIGVFRATDNPILAWLSVIARAS